MKETEIVVVKRLGNSAWIKELNTINKYQLKGSFKSADGTSSKTRISLGLDSRTGKRKIILTDEEQKFFEKGLGLMEGELSPNSKFWIDFSVDIEGAEIILKPEENIMDKLKLKLLMSKSIVAKSYNDIKSNSEYVIISQTEEAKKANLNRNNKKKAYTAFSKMTTSEMSNVLTVLGKKPTSLNPEVIENTLGSIVDSQPELVLSVIEHPNFKSLVYLYTLVNLGIIDKKMNTFLYKGEVLGVDAESCIKFLDNKENSLILSEINNEFKNKSNRKLTEI